MEKDSKRYSYETYEEKNSNCCLKKQTRTKKTESCRCFGKTQRSRTKAFFTGLATNLGICLLLFGYTLIGSVIFLAIEGESTFQHSATQILATTSVDSSKQFLNQSAEFRTKNEEARIRTVENIWDITVSLNILYRDNWTQLAAQEITRFQEELFKTFGEELARQQLPQHNSLGVISEEKYEWTFAKAFLYSLTVLTTIGYGNIAPRTTLGKAVTMGYAMLGIPLTLLYLSSIGSILSRVARGVFSRALCCCLCSNCGYCCYDEKRMEEKERRMKKKRQQRERQQQILIHEPFYVRSNSIQNNLNSPQRDARTTDDSLSCTADNESKSSSMHGLSILAPILLCLAMMLVYMCVGTFALHKLENWSLLDGFFFCFMSLTTIGFGNMVPGADLLAKHESTIWFCSIYIMSGMALTAMCFNVVHDEIVHRLKHQEKTIFKLNSTQCFTEDVNTPDAYRMAS